MVRAGLALERLPGLPFSDNTKGMAKSNSDNTKSRGRPVTTGTGTLIGVRLLDEPLGRVDAWAAKQRDKPSRPEAIRRLVALGLRVKKL